MVLEKAGANWVEGDRFFNWEVELEALSERVRDGTHTLLAGQRRMGKTSLVRELLAGWTKKGASRRFSTTWRPPAPRWTPSPRPGLGPGSSGAQAADKVGIPQHPERGSGSSRFGFRRRGPGQAPGRDRRRKLAAERGLSPLYVQQFFDHTHEHLRRASRRETTMEDVERVNTSARFSGSADRWIWSTTRTG